MGPLAGLAGSRPPGAGQGDQVAPAETRSDRCSPPYKGWRFRVSRVSPAQKCGMTCTDTRDTSLLARVSGLSEDPASLQVTARNGVRHHSCLTWRCSALERATRPLRRRFGLPGGSLAGMILTPFCIFSRHGLSLSSGEARLSSPGVGHGTKRVNREAREHPRGKGALGPLCCPRHVTPRGRGARWERWRNGRLGARLARPGVAVRPEDLSGRSGSGRPVPPVRAGRDGGHSGRAARSFSRRRMLRSARSVRRRSFVSAFSSLRDRSRFSGVSTA